MKNTVKSRYHVKLFCTPLDGSSDRVVYEVSLSSCNAYLALARVMVNLPDGLTIHTIEVCPDV